jgi:hypothetical protein
MSATKPDYMEVFTSFVIAVDKKRKFLVAYPSNFNIQGTGLPYHGMFF